MLAQDGHSCLPDPCKNHSCKNDETCKGHFDGTYTCICPTGYEKDASNICVDIDECKIPNWCQYGCVNTDGGYECQCPEGKVLRDDGRTCGIICYQCDGAHSNEECNKNTEAKG